MSECFDSFFWDDCEFLFDVRLMVVELDVCEDEYECLGFEECWDFFELLHVVRFQFFFGGLIVFGVAVVVVVVVFFASGDGGDSGLVGWLSWRPADDDVGVGVVQIAEHIVLQYKFLMGEQLVAVIGGKLEVVGLLMTIVLCKFVAAGGDIVFYEGDGVLFWFCGFGSKCAIVKGELLWVCLLFLRCEAFELVFYAFCYFDVDDVVVMLLSMSKGEDFALHFCCNDFEFEFQCLLVASIVFIVLNLWTMVWLFDAWFVDQVMILNMFNFLLMQVNLDMWIFFVFEPLVTF